ncbi:MAG: putative serine/threonine-protein phosphatase 5, partial [Streblomastix strix]
KKDIQVSWDQIFKSAIENSQLAEQLNPQNFSTNSGFEQSADGPLADPLDVPNRVTNKYAINVILMQSRQLLTKLPNIIDVNVPEGKKITIVGDLHGQFFNMLNIFNCNGKPSNENPYLFIGNYVDYGPFGTELLLVLLCFKLAYPQSVHLLRGNHESTMDVTLDEIRRVNRFVEPGEEGGDLLMAQMLWSEPTNSPGQSRVFAPFGCQFGLNSTVVCYKQRIL